MVRVPIYQIKDADVMEISNFTYEAVIKYFEGLTHTGYRSYDEVGQLLALLFIEEILYGPMSEYVTDNDYKMLNNALYCLYGSCLIPYPVYLEGKGTFNRKVMDSYRITESEILRGYEDHLRVLS